MKKLLLILLINTPAYVADFNSQTNDKYFEDFLCYKQDIFSKSNKEKNCNILNLESLDFSNLDFSFLHNEEKYLKQKEIIDQQIEKKDLYAKELFLSLLKHLGINNISSYKDSEVYIKFSTQQKNHFDNCINFYNTINNFNFSHVNLKIFAYNILCVALFHYMDPIDEDHKGSFTDNGYQFSYLDIILNLNKKGEALLETEDEEHRYFLKYYQPILFAYNNALFDNKTSMYALSKKALLYGIFLENLSIHGGLFENPFELNFHDDLHNKDVFHPTLNEHTIIIENNIALFCKFILKILDHDNVFKHEAEKNLSIYCFNFILRDLYSTNKQFNFSGYSKKNALIKICKRLKNFIKKETDRIIAYKKNIYPYTYHKEFCDQAKTIATLFPHLEKDIFPNVDRITGYNLDLVMKIHKEISLWCLKKIKIFLENDY